MKIRYLTASISIILLSFFFISSVFADSGKTYEVGTNNLNVRTAPSHSAEIIGQLNDGDRVIVFQESFGWVQTYYGGQEAWVGSQLLYQADNQTNSSDDLATVSKSSPEEITVTANEVRIRTGPGTKHEIIGYTSRGDTYNLVKSTNNWNNITLSDGSTGWIAGWLTDYNAGNGDNASETNTDSNSSSNSSGNSTNNGDQSQNPNPFNRSLEGYNIVLDPGHGGKDPGAIGVGGVFEKDAVMNTVDNVAQKLRSAGATVILTRNSDYFLSLEERVQMSDAYNAHAFISLHYNAFPILGANGVSTHFYSGGEDRQLASTLQSSLEQNISLYSRGIIQNNYHVLRENSDPAVLIELGFITNRDDRAASQSNAYHNNVADGITQGLLNFFSE